MGFLPGYSTSGGRWGPHRRMLRFRLLLVRRSRHQASAGVVGCCGHEDGEAGTALSFSGPPDRGRRTSVGSGGFSKPRVAVGDGHRRHRRLRSVAPRKIRDSARSSSLHLGGAGRRLRVSPGDDPLYGPTSVLRCPPPGRPRPPVPGPLVCGRLRAQLERAFGKRGWCPEDCLRRHTGRGGRLEVITVTPPCVAGWAADGTTHRLAMRLPHGLVMVAK